MTRVLESEFLGGGPVTTAVSPRITLCAWQQTTHLILKKNQ